RAGTEPRRVHLGLLEAARVIQCLPQGLLATQRSSTTNAPSHATPSATDHRLLAAIFFMAQIALYYARVNRSFASKDAQERDQVRFFLSRTRKTEAARFRRSLDRPSLRIHSSKDGMDVLLATLRKDGNLSLHAKAVMKGADIRKHTCVSERHSESRDTERWRCKKHLVLWCREDKA
ncbi:MAG: hypothetical protein QOH31_3581, partial [Verrucomicrobiota bacterium]